MKSFLAIGILIQSFWFIANVVADFPGDPYTVDLGHGNQDIEEQINAIPWTHAPFKRGYTVKDLSKVNFAGRDLSASTVRFLGNRIINANFDNCILDGSSFREVMFHDCTFRNVSMRYAEFDGLEGSTQHTNDLTNADITGSYFRTLTYEQFTQTTNFQAKRLSGVQISGALNNWNWNEFLLDGCLINRFDSDASLVDTTLLRMTIPLSLDFQVFRQTTNYKNKDLSNLLFIREPAHSSEQWDMSGCQLGYFFLCDLSAVDLKDAYFLPRVASSVRRLRADLPNDATSLYNSAAFWARGFDRCTATDAKMEETKNWKNKDIRCLHLRNMDLEGWDFSGFQMGEADLKGSNVKDAKFKDAVLMWREPLKLNDCSGLTVAQLLESNTFAGATRKQVIDRYWEEVGFEDLTQEEENYVELQRKSAKLRRIEVLAR